MNSNKQNRTQVKGKFIYAGEKKLYLKGVTYGTFRPNEIGELYPEPEMVDRDFARMKANGINSVRVYTVPPLWLLDLAERHNLYLMVGLPWEQHIAFLDDKSRIEDIKKRVRDSVRFCARHPSILCYVIGNEIPASIVRWYGRQPVENFLKDLYLTVKAEDPEALVTYVNYPSTEYLQLSFVDFVCFNVYLESQERLEAYLARLQNIAGERPLVMAEIGLDSLRNGQKTQAETLKWQIQTIFAAGCAGCFVFAWTDEWYRGGFDIEDWDFGLSDRQRCAKPALSAVSQAFAAAPFSANLNWPRFSVAVCSYNGASTIRDTLEALQHLDYPDYEVIVVDDGSTNGVAAIAEEYNVRVIIHSQNQGLSSARNTALAAATGEIVAYIDDDAYPDPHWLTYLAATFLKEDWAGVGGPNIPPTDDGFVADCVANAPGGPIHVLLSDREAEHIPGCNMAFWKTKLQNIGGFDPRFRAAGDDVDICWRLQERGWKIGFNPSAVVWHHRRNSVKVYWKQQEGYGKAEALLEQKWPQKYNAAGHLAWSGRLYGRGVLQLLGWRLSRIYHGTWGNALFQSLYQPAPSLFHSLPTMPEWYFFILALVGLSSLGLLWQPMFWTVPLLLAAIAAPVTQAILSASKASFTTPVTSRFIRFRLYSLTFFLYLLQPLARLRGRLKNGLTPWRRRGFFSLKFPKPRQDKIWSESWQSQEQWLAILQSGLQKQGAVISRGGDFDRWDLDVRGGLFGSVRILMTIEEHGGGKQLLRFRSWPHVSVSASFINLFLLLLCAVAACDRAVTASIILGVIAILLLLVKLHDCAAANSTYLYILKHLEISILKNSNLENKILEPITKQPVSSKQNERATSKGAEL